MSAAVVVQVGARTAVGLNAQQTGFLLRTGLPAMAEAPLADASGEAITMAFLPTLDPLLVGPERLVALAQGPFQEATQALLETEPVAVYLAIDEGCLEPELAAKLLKTMVHALLPIAEVRVDARGEAALGALLAAAMASLQLRQVRAVVLGGVHSDYDPRAIAALEAKGLLFSRENLDARIPGEAAAFFVLMRPEEAARLGLAPLARVDGVGHGKERATPDNEVPAYEAQGLTSAVRDATAATAEAGKKIGWMWTDLTGEMRRLNEWQSVFVRSQNVLGDPYVVDSPAQRIGYLGAAALPLFVAAAATAWKHGYAPSESALGIAGTDAGERAALVLSKV